MTNPDSDLSRIPAADPYAPPTAAIALHPTQAPALQELSIGPRIAGGLLLVNAALVLLEFAIVKSDAAGGSTPFDSPGRGLISACIDVGIGVSLLKNNRRVVPWAIARAAFGLVLLTLMLAFKDPYLAAMQATMCGSMLALLIGNASKPRVAVAASFFGLYALLSFIGIAASVTGRNPIAALIQGASGQIESAPAGVVTGEASHYRIMAPSDRWHLRNPGAAKKDNPLADRWLIRPDVDAHVLIIDERSTNGLFLIEPLADAVVKNVKDTSKSFQLHSRTPLKTYPEDGRLLHMQYSTNGLDITAYTAVVASGDRGYQVMAFAETKTFPEVEGELRRLVESFRLPVDQTPVLTDDVEPKPAGRVEGVAAKYVLVAPNDLWHVRHPEAAKKDNEAADRWISRPDKDAHAMVTVEDVPPGSQLDIEQYTDAVIAAVKNAMPGTVVAAREPLRTDPKNARLLHLVSTVGTMEVEYYYAVFAQKERGIQVVTWARKDLIAGVRDDLVKICETFVLPQ
jgi:hypothetical protein